MADANQDGGEDEGEYEDVPEPFQDGSSNRGGRGGNRGNRGGKGNSRGSSGGRSGNRSQSRGGGSSNQGAGGSSGPGGDDDSGPPPVPPPAIEVSPEIRALQQETLTIAASETSRQIGLLQTNLEGQIAGLSTGFTNRFNSFEQGLPERIALAIATQRSLQGTFQPGPQNVAPAMGAPFRGLQPFGPHIAGAGFNLPQYQYMGYVQATPQGPQLGPIIQPVGPAMGPRMPVPPAMGSQPVGDPAMGPQQQTVPPAMGSQTSGNPAMGPQQPVVPPAMGAQQHPQQQVPPAMGRPSGHTPPSHPFGNVSDGRYQNPNSDNFRNIPVNQYNLGPDLNASQISFNPEINSTGFNFATGGTTRSFASQLDVTLGNAVHEPVNHYQMAEQRMQAHISAPRRPVFDLEAKDVNPIGFIDEFCTFCTEVGANPREILDRILPTCLKGLARSWYSQNQPSWNCVADFEDQFKLAFMNAQEVALLAEQAVTVKQAYNEDPSLFITKKVVQLSTYHGDLTASQKLKKIISLLHPYYVMQLHSYYIIDIPTLQRAVQNINDMKTLLTTYESPLDFSKNAFRLQKTAGSTLAKEFIAQNKARLEKAKELDTPAYLPKRQYAAAQSERHIKRNELKKKSQLRVTSLAT